MYTGHRFFSGLADGQRVGSSTFYGLCGLGFGLCSGFTIGFRFKKVPMKFEFSVSSFKI